MLTAVRVEEVLKDCLVGNAEEPHVPIQGIIHTYGLKTDKLKEHEAEILEMLGELPETFRKSVGGGWSFLNACQDKHGNQWTGMQMVMDQLFVLGTGIGKVSLLMPREMWSALPGGMPYYSIDI